MMWNIVLWIIILIVILVVGLALGFFAFCNIIYPLFVAWPKAKKLEAAGEFTKPIPIKAFIIAPIVWTILVALSIWLVIAIFPMITLLYLIELVIILIVVIAQIPKKKSEIYEEFFKDVWKSHLKGK